MAWLCLPVEWKEGGEGRKYLFGGRQKMGGMEAGSGAQGEERACRLVYAGVADGRWRERTKEGEYSRIRQGGDRERRSKNRA